MIIKHAKLHQNHACLTSSSKEPLQQFHDNPTKSLDTETRSITGGYSLYIKHFSYFANNTYNPPQLFSWFTYLNPKESKCSKQRNSNFINNWTLLILFILFHDCWNLKMWWMYGCAFEKCSHYQPRYHVHNLSPPGYKMQSLLASVSRTQLVTSRV